jgi:metal-responsive CopG/Arc/MetJ family transcriptional regulator
MHKVARNRRISIWLNDEEFKALDRYLSRAEPRKRAEHVREILMRHIWTQLEENYPTLFPESEMRR